MVLEGPKKCQDELEDAMHQKIQRSIGILQNAVFYNSFKLPSRLRTSLERPKTISYGHVVGPETTRRTAQSNSESELRKEAEKELQKGSKKDLGISLNRVKK